MTKHVLISIKPRYAAKIWSGEKRYEFRRAIPQEHVPLVTRFYVYESAPVQRITGYFIVGRVIFDREFLALWDATKESSGISFGEFFRYFEGAPRKHALDIKLTKRFHYPIELWEIGLKRAPQNFLYLTREQSRELESFGISLLPWK